MFGLNFLNKKKTVKRELKLHQVSLVNINKTCIKNLYIGQIVSISADIKKDKQVYSLETYPGYNTIGYLSSKDEIYGEKYQYAIIRNISDTSIDVCIIVIPAFLKRTRLKLSNQIENGTILFIKSINNEYHVFDEDNNDVGIISDRKFTPDIIPNIAFSQYDNGDLCTVVYK